MDSQRPQNTSPHVAIVTREDGSTFARPRFTWDMNREQAAVDLAEGQYSLTEIAARAGVHVGVISRWRQHPDFTERVESHRKVFREQVLSFGLARKEVRLQYLQDRRDKIIAVVTARGEAFRSDPSLAKVPGGETGYVYEHVTKNGTEYLIDNKTAALLNDIEKQAAVELGEWNEGTTAAVAVQIVCPASAPAASAAPTVTIGGVK